MSNVYLVESALRDNQEARNSDKVLLLQVWHSLGFNLTPAQTKQFLDLPSPDTFTRVRRKLQEEGKYLATDAVKDTRDFMGYQIQQQAPNAIPEQLNDLLQGKLL